MKSKKIRPTWRMGFVFLVIGAWITLFAHAIVLRIQRREVHRLKGRIQALENKVIKGHDRASEAGVSSKIGALEASKEE